jgi:hypothetical protein
MTAAARSVSAILLALGLVAGVGGGVARATTLDPFRRVGGPQAASLDPVRVADATPAPAAAAPAPASPAEPAAKACQNDDECPAGNFCQDGACRKIEKRTNFLYLYYKQGSFKEILLLYWSKKGPEGYTVLVPFYWHFYRPGASTTVIVPVLPISWSSGPAPGQSSFAIWPLFYRSNRAGWAAPLLGTFALRDPDAGTAGGAVGFLYWWRRGPDRALDIAIPLFVSKRSSARSFTFALPLNFYYRNGDTATTLALPFFYYRSWKDGASFYTWLGYHRRQGRATANSIAWLYWFGGNEGSGAKYDVLFPLVWSFRRPESNTTIAGPFLHFRRGDKALNALVPLWWGWRGENGDGFHISPLYFWRRSDSGKGSLLLTPLGGYARDDRAGTRTWLAVPLLSFSRTDPERALRVFTPFYVSHTNNRAHSTTRLGGLLFYHRRDPEGSTTGLFPLFWHFHDVANDSSATLLLPVFARRSGPRDTTTIFTLLYWRSFKNGGWSGGLFPVAHFGSNNGRRHAVLVPLLWHFGDESSSTTLALPLFYWHRDKHGYDSAWAPLLFFGNHDGDRYAVQFPLFWHFASARKGSSTTVTPIGYVHTDRDGWSAALGPLVPLVFLRSGKTRSHFALVPFIWHFKDRTADKTTTVVGPYWHRSWGRENTDALFPLFHYRRGARPGGNDETSFTLFPLVHYRRDADTRLLVTPLGASARGPNRRAGFLGPYFWYDDKDLSARFIPFLYADVERKDIGERRRQVLNWFQIDAPGRKARVLFPLFGHYQDANETDTWAFPNFFRMRRANGDRVDSFLIYWRSTFGDRTTTVVGPYYRRTGPDSHSTGVVPLFFYASDPQRTMTVVPLAAFFYRRHHQEDRTFLWWGPVFHRSDRDGRTTGVFPLVWSRRRGPRSTDIGFPLYWHFADSDAKTSLTIIPPLFFKRNDTRWTAGIAPVAWLSRDSVKGEGSAALLPLFYQSSGPDRTTFLTAIGGYSRNGPSRFWYAGPLWINHHNEATDTSTRVVPPLLLLSRTSPSSRFTTFLGLFWRHSDVVSSRTIVLPLFYDIHDYHARRTTLLLPLFIRHSNAGDGSSTLVAPLFYRRTTPTDSSTVLFPLVWDFKRGNDRRTTVVFPVYAHWRRPTHEGTWIFPTYYSRHGLNPDGSPDGTWRRLILPLFDTEVKRPGDFMWEVLGGLVGHERIGQHRFLRLLWLLEFESGPAPRAQTAWYSQPPRTSRKTAARGLSVAGF